MILWLAAVEAVLKYMSYLSESCGFIIHTTYLYNLYVRCDGSKKGLLEWTKSSYHPQNSVFFLAW